MFYEMCAAISYRRFGKLALALDGQMKFDAELFLLCTRV